jgi:hypothetical protein
MDELTLPFLANPQSVQKSAKEIWTFSTDKDAKGPAKVGDKITAYYNMVATQIEAKARRRLRSPRSNGARCRSGRFRAA